MYIHWDKVFETGQPLVDAEHRLLILLFKKLDVAIKTNRSDAMLASIIVEVRKFVEFHFASEENLMGETKYPGFAAHRNAHTKLSTELGVLISRLALHREYPNDFLSFVSRWLVEHISTHDQALAAYVRTAVNRPVAELDYSEYLLTASSDVSPKL